MRHDLVVVSAYQPQRQSELMAVQRAVTPDVLWRLQPISAVQMLLDEAMGSVPNDVPHRAPT